MNNLAREKISEDSRAYLLVETVSDGGGGGLVDDTQNVKTGDGTGVFGGLALGIVEIGAAQSRPRP